MQVFLGDLGRVCRNLCRSLYSLFRHVRHLNGVAFQLPFRVNHISRNLSRQLRTAPLPEVQLIYCLYLYDLLPFVLIRTWTHCNDPESGSQSHWDIYFLYHHQRRGRDHSLDCYAPYACSRPSRAGPFFDPPTVFRRTASGKIYSSRV